MEYMCFVINICTIAASMFFAIREFDIFTNGRCVKKIRIKSFARYLGIGIAMFVIICLDWKIFGISTYDDLYYFVTTMKTR